MSRQRPDEPLPLRHEAERARKELQRFDSRLDFWWSDRRGCWQVVEWLNRAGVWSHVFNWTGPAGEYRGLLPITPIIARLGECDWEKVAARAGLGEGFQAAVEDDLGRARRALVERRRQEREQLRKDYLKDVMERSSDFLEGTGGAKLRAWNEARAEYREVAYALSGLDPNEAL